MNLYSSCFIGIALPQEYQSAFEELLTEIKASYTNIETVQQKTPHITLYYLNKQSQYSIDKIANLIKPKINILKNSSLTVGGFDYFTEENPEVIFLNVKFDPSLSNFNKSLLTLLHKYGDVDNNHPFHPHVTVGRIVDIDAKESFFRNRDKLQEKLDAIKWDFTCNEITLYGVDASQSPQHQEKLIVVPSA